MKFMVALSQPVAPTVFTTTAFGPIQKINPDIQVGLYNAEVDDSTIMLNKVTIAAIAAEVVALMAAPKS